MGEVWRALTAPDPQLFDHAVLRDLRLQGPCRQPSWGPRGGGRGADAGGDAQTPRRPGTMGLLAGASSAVVVASAGFGLGGHGRL